MSILVHIGWQKCASTSLQRAINSRMPASVAANRAIFVEHNRILDAVRAGHSVATIVDATSRHLRNAGLDHVGGDVAISDERLTAWRGTHACEVISSDETVRYQRVWAQTLARTFPNRRILLVIREPRSWLRSLYQQDVKCGAALSHLTFRDWAAGNEQHLRIAGDPVLQTNLFDAAFGSDRVDVVDFDAIRQNPLQLPTILSNRFETELDDEAFASTSNASLPDHTTELLRRVHLIIRSMTESLSIDPTRERNLLDHLFWFVNDAAEKQPDFRAEVDAFLPELLARTFGVDPDEFAESGPTFDGADELVRHLTDRRAELLESDRLVETSATAHR